MALFNIPNVRIAGISACVPKNTIFNEECETPLSDSYDNKDFVKVTGVSERRFDDNIKASDLFIVAATKLINDLNWDKSEIEALIVVTQTPDYILPATSCIIQDKLGLKKDCLSFDISLGCSGWIYGVSTLASYLQNGKIKKGLLLVGDGRWHIKYDDPLFGLAGTATALVFDDSYDTGLNFDLGTDGSGFDSLIIPDGGAENRITPNSFVESDYEGHRKNRLMPQMKGMDVFSFGISVAPKSIKRLCNFINLPLQDIDYLFLHQSNKKMNDRITKKLGVGEEKVPIGLKKFGNTSSASIPLAMVTEVGHFENNTDIVCCGFGVGLSWGALQFKSENIILSSLQEI